jgi:hypothetical protein
MNVLTEENAVPTKPIKQFTAWSFSRYHDHKECPRRAKLKHLDKVPEGPKGPALIRGEHIHKLAEDFVGSKLKKLPSDLKNFTKEFVMLRKKKAVTEGKWAMTVGWKVCDFFDWATAWCRVVLDSHYAEKKRARVIDYKTGKIYGDNDEQMELYAIAGFEHYPDVDEIDTELWYLDQGELQKKTYRRKDLPALQKKWKRKVIPILTDKRFPPRPGQQCSYCAYSIRKHNPKAGKPLCEF